MLLRNVFYVLLSVQTIRCQTCLDNNGNPVDWFVAYKLPPIPEALNPSIVGGLAYAYIDANSNAVTIYQNAADANGVFARMTDYVLNAQQDPNLLTVIYNDQVPEETGSAETFAHAKGFLTFSQQQGFWVMHSIPRFPILNPPTFQYRYEQRQFGQTFFCISLDISYLNRLGVLLYGIRPKIIGTPVVPNWVAATSDYMHHIVVEGNYVRTVDPNRPYSVLESLCTPANQLFVVFGQSMDFGSDIYSDLIAPKYQRGFYVQTYRSGRAQKVDPTCFNHAFVTNILNMTVHDPTYDEDVIWGTYNDHSKFAISEQGQTVCFGDTNRVVSQFARGGAAICLDHPVVHDFYRRAIHTVQCCNNNLFTTNCMAQPMAQAPTLRNKHYTIQLNAANCDITRVPSNPFQF